jgi:hypothetical protein
MKSRREILDAYASQFRSLLNDKVIPTNDPIRKTLRLSKDSDWEFLCASMDIVADASQAIEHVQRFGLYGATKYIETGECYLRLYDLLSAAYIQQDAVFKIYKMMNVTNPGSAKKRINELEIRSLRHKIAAHSTNYDSDGTLEAYAPVRFEIKDKAISYVKYTDGFTPIKSVDLEDAIEIHLQLMNCMMDKILEKKQLVHYIEDKTKRRRNG